MKLNFRKTMALALGFSMVLSSMAFAGDSNKLITFDFWHAVSDQASMGNLATDNNEKALYISETNILQMGTNPVDVSGFQSGVKEILYDTSGKGNYKAVEVLATGIVETGTKNDGVNHTVEFVNKFQLELPSYITKTGVEYIPIKMAVPHTPMDIVVGEGYLDARIRLDWTESEDTDITDLVTSLEISAGEVNAMGTTDAETGIKVSGDSTIISSAAVLEVTTITEGSQYDTAKTAVETGDFDLYEVQMVVDGENQTPTGSLEVTFPYSKDTTVYRISDTGIKTILRGLYKDGEYMITTRQLGLFALVGGENMYTGAVEEVVTETATTETATEEVSATTFGDVTGHWAATNIYGAVEAGLFSGTSATAFSPDASMTNAMAITVLYRVAGEPTVESDGATWYSNAMAWGYNEGIIGGYNDFDENADVTRQELATMLFKYEQTQGGASERADLSSFSDVTNIATWAEDAFSWANAMGIINGTSTTALSPQAGATRAQVATMMMTYSE